MRTPLTTTTGMDNTLRVFPDFAATRTSRPGRKRVPHRSASALPVRFSIGFPITFWAANMNVIHGGVLFFCEPKGVKKFCHSCIGPLPEEFISIAITFAHTHPIFYGPKSFFRVQY